MATTTVRNLRLIPTSQRMSSRRIEFGAEEFRGADGDDDGPGRRAGRGGDHAGLHLVDRDGLADVDPGAGLV